MCGIHAYICPTNEQANAVDVCLQGLELLEYRGYDSSGVAGIIDGKIRACKRVGKVHALKSALALQKLKLTTAIAHTRWATHGVPNEENAHPQLDQAKTVALVHNGIIENYLAIRKKLEDKGVFFRSDTDSEVIAQLIAHYYQGNLRCAVTKALRELHGSFAIAAIHIHHPEEIIAASRESPLVIGLDPNKKGAYLSSDANSFSGQSLHVTYLNNDEVASVRCGQIEVYDLQGKKVEKAGRLIGFKNTPVSKNGFDHFMLKEIFEQPQTVQRAMQKRCYDEFGTATFDELTLSPQELQTINRVVILGCGTAWHAGVIAALMFEDLARIPAEAKIASEFRYTNPLISKNTLVITISQSGETADTIAAVREAKAKGAKVIAVCNVPHSTIARDADSCLFLKAGPEISVCSTKAFTSQLTVLALFSLLMARLRHLGKTDGQKFLKELKHLPTKITQVLSQAEVIETFAKVYAPFSSFFFLGRHYMYPTSLEAALKLKEISYLNATGYPAGEMKHGPLALISPDLAVIGMCGNSQTLDKTLSNLMEVKARGGRVLAFAPKGRDGLLKITPDVIWLPKTHDMLASIPYSIAGQLFAYYSAKIQGTDIDQPRHLAKSVTVE